MCEHILDKQIKVLQLDENFKISEFEDMLDEWDDDVYYACIDYRATLLKRNRQADHEEILLTSSSLEKAFLEPVDSRNLPYIENLLKLHGHTITDVYKDCKKFGVRLFLVVSCLNTKTLEA